MGGHWLLATDVCVCGGGGEGGRGRVGEVPCAGMHSTPVCAHTHISRILHSRPHTNQLGCCPPPCPHTDQPRATLMGFVATKRSSSMAQHISLLAEPGPHPSVAQLHCSSYPWLYPNLCIISVANRPPTSHIRLPHPSPSFAMHRTCLLPPTANAHNPAAYLVGWVFGHKAVIVDCEDISLLADEEAKAAAG
jgi:hypothetical protein